ncbi:MAG: hypothetical protein CO108_12380 [Deltaproteobacteria bacterium CG_4_9_14_3_um_filter_63_12]|nr:MAG: hypothetical protein CO108_12380 [Deltaproteobacteria bacterium CG_4_9_14_3_um_filter_63_12]
MKLHRIELENLNSLYGSHSLDFEEDLGDAPLFLILGPTGSGKSTVLDAVCLALFGQTPRLELRKGQNDTQSWHIMSHGTAHCAASLVFSKLDRQGARRTYRAAWSCRRARNDAEGAPQPAIRSLEAFDDPQAPLLLVSSHKLKDVDPVFAEALEGFTVEDFKRSVLLPQGQFAAFLKAGRDERASILERLTSTDVYKRVGERAAERERTARQEVDRLESRIGDLPLAAAEHLEAMVGTLTELEQSAANLDAEWRALDADVAWRVEATRAEHELALVLTGLDAVACSRQEHRSELAALARDVACRPAAAALAERDRLAQAHSSNLAARTHLDGELAAKTEEEKALDGELARALERSKGCAAARLEAAAELEEARKLHQAAAYAVEEHLRAEADFGRIQSRFAEVENDWQSLVAEATRLRALVATAERTESAARVPAELRERLPSLSERQRLLEVEGRALGQAQSEVGALQERVDQGTGSIAQLQAQLAQEEATSTASRTAEAVAQAALAQVVAEAPDPAACRAELRRRREAVTAQLEKAREALRLGKEAQQRRDQVERDGEVLSRLELELKASSHTAEALRASVEEREQAVKVLAVELEKEREREAFADARRRLEDGEACPLCGSLEHPSEHSLVQATADRSTVGSRLEQVERELRADRVALEKTVHEGAVSNGRCVQLTASLAALSLELAQLDEARALATRGLGEGGPAQDDLERWLEELRAELTALDGREEALDQALGVLDAAHRQATQQVARSARTRETLAAREATHSALLETLTRARTEADSRSERLAGAEVELLALLTELGSPGSPDFAGLPASTSLAANDVRSARSRAARAALDDAQRRLTLHAESLNALRECTLELGAIATRELTTRSTHAELAQSVAAAQASLSERAENKARTEAAKASALGGRNPVVVEVELEQAVAAATEQLEGVRGRVGVLRSAIALLTGELQGVSRQGEQLAADLATAEASLQEALSSAGLADEGELRAAVLTDEQRGISEALEKRLLQEELVAKSRRQAALDAVEALQGRRPPASDSALSLELATAAREATRTQLEGQLEQLGSLRERVRQLTQARDEHLELNEALVRAREGHRTWREIAELIGTGRGEAFKAFAQILNLRELVERANTRLRALAPRYALQVKRDDEGHAELGFTVRDEYQAGIERPLTTLSGGETFLVSLSLALALGDYREVEMPIETLLLDEGFDTLDAETLSTAMDALERLQAVGTRVGLISHVNVLRERVAARVLVEPLGGGRSRLVVEA